MKTTAKDNSDVIAPPPFIFLFFFAAGYGIERIYPLIIPEMMALFVAGWIIVVLSLMIVVGSFISMKRHKTAINPYKTSTTIVENGPFRFTRNPIYLSLSLLYLGVALILQIIWPLLFLPLTLLVMHFGVIVREETYLERKFGDQYRSYKNSVPRWLF